MTAIGHKKYILKRSFVNIYVYGRLSDLKNIVDENFSFFRAWLSLMIYERYFNVIISGKKYFNY